MDKKNHELFYTACTFYCTQNIKITAMFLQFQFKSQIKKDISNKTKVKSVQLEKIFDLVFIFFPFPEA